MSKVIGRILCFNSLGAVLLVSFFFLHPAIRAVLDIRDAALRQPGVPKVAWRLYRNLTPRYATWAKIRIAQGRAETLSTSNISGTEWPLFGSVFYLWALENLQTAWEAGDHTAGVEPRFFAHDAIIASSELVIDPRHASWVKKHWGENYLHRENVFYRMLVIASLTSREKLLHDHAHLDLLRDQVETFAAELDSSHTGLLDDYPGECYPGDVMAALMCIKRADAVLGTDHSGFIDRSLRGFTGARATPHQLPPYSASSGTGIPSSDARGCGNSYMCLTAPELWPDQAKAWFEQYDKFFWQYRITADGFREYAKDVPNSDWTMDVDAGPVIAGHGVAASAFGIGAARKNGRFDRAYPLATELLVTIGELPNGVLAIPRLLSNASDAPLLGEAAILWQLSIQPENGFAVKTGGRIPLYVHLVLAALFLFSAWCIGKAVRTFLVVRREPRPNVRAPGLQLTAWICVMLAAVVALLMHRHLAGTAALFVGVMLPVTGRRVPEDDVPGADEEIHPARMDASATRQ